MKFGICLIGLMVMACVVSEGVAQVPQKKWERSKKPLLTNFNNMYNPCVVEAEGEYRFRMWFFGWANDHTNQKFPGCDAIYHARSKDLKKWEVFCGDGAWDDTMNPELWVPVIHASERWFEAWHTGDPAVVLKDGVFYMAYSATSKHFSERDGYPSTMVQCLMGATSEDGLHWEKSAEPILIRKGDKADPDPQPGRIGDFHRPSLHWEDGKWRLWFDYWHPDHGVCMGYAENDTEFLGKNGFRIQHELTQPLLKNWPNPNVVRIDGVYHSFADPTGYPIEEGESHWKSRQLCEAISDDGIRWKRLDFIDPDRGIDACQVPEAFVTTLDGKRWLFLFYATQIGYRKKDGSYHYQYDQIRAMKRELVREMRTFRDITGEHRIKALPQAMDDQNVCLLKEDGDLLTMPLKSLSRTDQAYLSKLDLPNLQKGAANDSDPDYRIFVDATGQHETEAKFVELANEKVVLLKRDGSTVSLPLNRLSDDDQEYVLNQLKKD